MDKKIKLLLIAVLGIKMNSALKGSSIIDAVEDFDEHNLVSSCETYATKKENQFKSISTTSEVRDCERRSPKSSPVSVADDLTTNYPATWNRLTFPAMFKLLKDRRINDVTPQFIDQWMNAIEDCYRCFKKEKDHTEVNFSRSIYDLATKAQTSPKIQEIILDRLSNRPEWIQKWFTATVHILSEFNSRNLSEIMYALKEFDISPPSQWRTAFFQASQDKINSFNLVALSNMMYTLGRLGINPPETWLGEVQTYVSHDLEYLSRTDKHQLFLFASFQKSQRIPSFLDDALLSSWTDEFREESHRDNYVSNTERRVGQELNRRDRNFRPSIFIPEIASTVDFYKRKTNIILQVDGPTHFLPNGDHDASTKFQTKMLENFGYRVLRLDYKEWDSKGDLALRELLGR